MAKCNVFSDDKSQLSVLVHTASFVSSPEKIQYFNDANKLKSIRVFFMPIISVRNENRFETGEYKHHREQTMVLSSLSFPLCSSIVSIHHTVKLDATDAELSMLTEENILQGKIASDLFDYIVTGSAFTASGNVPVVDFARCKEIMRLFLVYKGTFFVSEHIKIDETFYYIYRHKVVFSELQNFWSASLNANRLDDWIDALDNRLTLMTIAFDKCKIEANKRQNNCTIMYLKYHISYLLLLATGTFDNLAWLINNLYALNLQRMKIDIRKDEFKKAIKTVCPPIYEKITTSQFEDKVDAIRKLRDRIVHRDFFQMARSEINREGLDKSYMHLDASALALLLNGGFPESAVAIKTQNESWIDVLAFIEFVESTTVEIVNYTVKILAKEIYHSENKWCIWKLMKLPCAPYVL